MKHDELLWAINSVVEAGPCVSVGHWSSAKALLAVVELHKPSYNPNFEDSESWCWQCAEGRGYAKYPCPTIQAIEKELG